MEIVAGASCCQDGKNEEGQTFHRSTMPPNMLARLPHRLSSEVSVRTFFFLDTPPFGGREFTKYCVKFAGLLGGKTIDTKASKVKRLSILGCFSLLVAFWPALAPGQSIGTPGSGVLSAPALSGPSPSSAFRIALPEEYRLGPGDLLDIVIAGRVEVTRHSIVVSPEGRIHIPPVGGISVGGLTLPQARDTINQTLSTVFRFSDVTVSVAQARAFEVSVTGEVAKPGSYQVTALDRLSQLLQAAGGTSPRGSIRRVTLITRGRPDRSFDLLKYAFHGELRENPTLTEGTTVYVPPQGEVVTLQGHVRRPGEYELTTERTIQGVLALAGGGL